LGIATRTLLRPHDIVATDALTYPGFKMLAHVQALTLKAIPVLSNGPDLDALDALCRGHRIRAIYTMPTLHNPLGWVLTATQREQLVDIARCHDYLLIEDAAYAFLAGETPPALVALAPPSARFTSLACPRVWPAACVSAKWWPRKPLQFASRPRSERASGAPDVTS